ncbi:MAG: histidine kinase [Bacteroidales bacterium]|nr:histidine kinase [Bacteroidales bacterium]
MDYQLMIGQVFKRWHVVAMGILVVVFSFGTYGIKQKVNSRTNELSRSIIHGSTVGYQKFLNNYFDQYDRILSQVAYVYDELEIANKQKHAILDAMLQLDSSIVSIAVFKENAFWIAQSLELSDSIPNLAKLQHKDVNNLNAIVLAERYMFVGHSLKHQKGSWCALLIDLNRLHKQFIFDNIYTSIYQVVINQHQQCIYHPDIEKVGKQYMLPPFMDEHIEDENSQWDTLLVAQSDYLQLPVFKEYSRMTFQDNSWIVLNVSPGFEVKDMVAEQEGNMFLLFFLFLFMLLLIIVVSIINWKRELLLRANAEQEHLNLLLKHEKQKSDTISIKLELLRSGLNSHFMFNSLGTVKALLNKNAEAARAMLSDLSKLYRYQLTIEGEQLVTLREELNFTQKYVDVINLRSNSSIIMKIHNLDECLDYKVLPVSLQLLVENCIKHNIASELQPLTVDISMKDGQVIVENELRPKETIGEASGKGLKNLNTRYNLIAQRECTFMVRGGCFIATIPLIKQ